MFLDLPHTKLDVYQCSRKLVLECYKLSKILPGVERFGLIQQIRRASTSVSLNIAEGSSRRSPVERRRYFEIARSSVVEIDSILDLCFDLEYCKIKDLEHAGILLLRSFKMLSSLMTNS